MFRRGAGKPFVAGKHASDHSVIPVQVFQAPAETVGALVPLTQLSLRHQVTEAHGDVDNVGAVIELGRWPLNEFFSQVPSPIDGLLEQFFGHVAVLSVRPAISQPENS